MSQALKAERRQIIDHALLSKIRGGEEAECEAEDKHASILKAAWQNRQPQDLLMKRAVMIKIFRGAKLYSPEASIPQGELWIEENKILRVSAQSAEPPPDAEIHQLEGRHICPGFIDPHVHMGLMPEGFAFESKDINEMTRALTPELRALDAVWPGDIAFARARQAGITTVCALPGSSNVIGGAGVVLRTTGRDVEQMSRLEPACLKIAFGYSVKHSHGLKGRAPLTRMEIAALGRRAFEEALLYEQARVLDPKQLEDPGKEMLLKALRREIPVRAHASRSDDLLSAIRLARRYGLKLVLEHAHEADFILEALLRSKAEVVLGPAFRSCGHSEELHFRFETAQILDEAGVRVALMSDHPILPVSSLPIHAGLCVRAGMSPARALACITHNPAQILGLEEQIGRLSPGLEADFLILDGPPLEIASRVLETWIGGRRVYQGEPLPVPGAAFS